MCVVCCDAVCYVPIHVGGAVLYVVDIFDGMNIVGDGVVCCCVTQILMFVVV